MATTNGTLYWWIANVAEKGKPAAAHAEFLREHLARAAAKLGAEPTIILCNADDADAIRDLKQGGKIAVQATLPPGNFRIGADGTNGSSS